MSDTVFYKRTMVTILGLMLLFYGLATVYEDKAYVFTGFSMYYGLLGTVFGFGWDYLDKWFDDVKDN